MAHTQHNSSGYRGFTKNWSGGNSSHYPNAQEQVRQVKKHSGCTAGVIGKGEYQGKRYLSGWKYSKRDGMVSFLAVPYNKSTEHRSETGKVWIPYMVKVQPKMQKEYIVSGLYDVQTNRVIIKELGIVMNPKGGRGGYCGSFINTGK